jgi:glutamate-1-semialdehyde aminotransferase
LPGLEPRGVPRGLRGTALPFNYNKLEELEEILHDNKDEIGTIVMEPIRNKKPEKGFIEGVRKLADKNGIILVIDEVSAGWRINNGGYHLNFSIEPDMAVFAKGMSNGYPMSAIIGKKEVMEAAQTTFISSTYWTERIGATAAIATIKKYKKHNVGDFLKRAGEKVINGWAEAAKKTKLEIHLDDALPPMAHFGFEYENKKAMQTLFTQLMLARGYLANGAYYATYAHKDPIIKAYLNNVEEVFGIIAKALREEKIEKMLKGPIAHDGFKRLN